MLGSTKSTSSEMMSILMAQRQEGQRVCLTYMKWCGERCVESWKKSEARGEMWLQRVLRLFHLWGFCWTSLNYFLIYRAEATLSLQRLVGAFSVLTKISWKMALISFLRTHELWGRAWDSAISGTITKNFLTKAVITSFLFMEICH